MAHIRHDKRAEEGTNQRCAPEEYQYSGKRFNRSAQNLISGVKADQGQSKVIGELFPSGSVSTVSDGRLICRGYNLE